MPVSGPFIDLHKDLDGSLHPHQRTTGLKVRINTDLPLYFCAKVADNPVLISVLNLPGS